MRMVRISVLVAAVGVLIASVLAAPATARVSTYKGQFQCDDRGSVAPLAGMNVELWERGSPDFLPVEWVGHRVDQDFTTADGSFAMTTEDNNDNYFVRMALRDAYGVHLRDFWGINDWSVDTGQRRNDVPVQDYGGLLFSTPGQSHKCAIWAGVHAAYERYRAEIGSELPSHGVELQADAVTAGVPFTPGTSILWPGGFPVGYGGGGDDSITRHEFGHVIRHGFDGCWSPTRFRGSGTSTGSSGSTATSAISSATSSPTTTSRTTKHATTPTAASPSTRAGPSSGPRTSPPLPTAAGPATWKPRAMSRRRSRS